MVARRNLVLYRQPAGAAQQPTAGGADRPAAPQRCQGTTGSPLHHPRLGGVARPSPLHPLFAGRGHRLPLRWRLIKSHFSRALPMNERRSQTRLRNGERGIWQRHYWEHLIRDEQDYRHHMDYVHINPLKHGHVSRVADWPYSTFHRYVASGVYPPDWCGSVDGPLGGLSKP